MADKTLLDRAKAEVGRNARIVALARAYREAFRCVYDAPAGTVARMTRREFHAGMDAASDTRAALFAALDEEEGE